MGRRVDDGVTRWQAYESGVRLLREDEFDHLAAS